RDPADLRRLPAHAVRRLALAELGAGAPARGGAVRAPRRRARRAAGLARGHHDDHRLPRGRRRGLDRRARLRPHAARPPPASLAAPRLGDERGGARRARRPADRLSALRSPRRRRRAPPPSLGRGLAAMGIGYAARRRSSSAGWARTRKMTPWSS